MPGFLQPKTESGESTAAAPRPGKPVERDVEAPEIFQTKESGLWDGRPSLGGVWTAHPDVKDPERVIIRNEENGKYVIGALFRKERETPGPRLQISSDAAAALGMLAGQPAKLSVVALRRETAIEEEPMPEPAEAPATGALDAPSTVATSEIDPVAATAAAALNDPAPAPAAAPKPAAKPKPKPAASSSMSKPYLQIGIFSVEQNASNTATALRQSGMVPTVKKQSSSGKTFWRVLVGPAQSKSEQDTLLKTIKGMGFADAYAVTN
ncbi:SPOR domain-containing protein [Mesobacterium sp. TK19101]|uniref:SPOR domain-containing protein n=1 Tax=Mesobacterium hydrothermale TaxID=3111907 RepID=A0ABU6HC85_9RHOB|nr:SPOR domain-containing protein [Mesobacterium sp. TK19101]MEC3860087.1 SPOR domain-containing protein [Mesobacterium sp. TK19101]